MATIEKSAGTTASEQYLARLCKNSFLSLWSYPNLFRDQGRPGGKGDGKELCDLLVVFGNDVIIFSDKSCQFPDGGPTSVNWQRWFKRSIVKSVDQVFGAERWIREHPDKIFLDRRCTQPFPLRFPPADTCRFHRVVVALNASAACKEFFDNNGTGSLMIRPFVTGEREHLNWPFCVGQLYPNKGYVHVLDDYSLDVVMQDRDTVTDFVRYLAAKEEFILSGKLMTATGEEDLLAHYLSDIAPHGDHDFVFPAHVDAVWLMEGIWLKLKSSPQYIGKKQADEPSYVWDALIETFSHHYEQGTLEYGSDLPLTELARGVHIMAGETRLSRRGLGISLHDLFSRSRTVESWRHIRVMISRDRPDVGYVILLLSTREDKTYAEYREFRIRMLSAYCHVAKTEYPELQHVIGIATEPLGTSAGRSEDMVYLDASTWTPEDDAESRWIQDATGILVSPVLT
jgi:hypothetical protein